jgi:predicted RNase H-like nuclease (RuvC/YqgF family)
MKLMLTLILFVSSALAVQSFYLTNEDQKYFRNDSVEGNNQRERIDLNVKEINKLHGEISALKAEVQTLKKTLEEMKKP